GPVPAPRLAAGCDGRPDAGLGAHPRRDDGHGRRLHGHADDAALRARARDADAHRLGGRLHGAPGGHHGLCRERHQARARLLHGHLAGPFVLLALTAFLTAFYMFRVVFIAFFGRPHDAHAHPHEAPPLMAVPLWILAGLTVGIGLRFVVHPLEGEHGPSWLAP